MEWFDVALEIGLSIIGVYHILASGFANGYPAQTYHVAWATLAFAVLGL